ncbi:MAG: glycosyltransferase family 1 protein [Alloprevotella sp.]
MKILFLTFLYLEKTSGISKKIQAQVRGLQRGGAEAHLCHFAALPDGRHWALDGEDIGRLGGRKEVVWKNVTGSYFQPVLRTLREGGYDWLYFRYNLNATPFMIRFMSEVRKLGVRIVMEIPTYPYDGEFRYASFMGRVAFAVENRSRRRFRRYVDAIVTFSTDKEIFGVPCVNLSNAVAPEQIPLRAKLPRHNYVRMTGVANLSFWHGYDRLIRGIAAYRAEHPDGREVHFDVVGGGEIRTQLEELAKELGVEQFVHFHGLLSGEALNEVFLDTDLCIGSFGCHRKNILEVKTLKNVEYAMRGIPMAYSEQNNDFDGRPYVLKASADESPVDVADLLHQFDRAERDPETIRRSVAHLTWDFQMKKLLEVLQR